MTQLNFDRRTVAHLEASALRQWEIEWRGKQTNLPIEVLEGLWGELKNRMDVGKPASGRPLKHAYVARHFADGDRKVRRDALPLLILAKRIEELLPASGNPTGEELSGLVDEICDWTWSKLGHRLGPAACLGAINNRVDSAPGGKQRARRADSIIEGLRIPMPEHCSHRPSFVTAKKLEEMRYWLREVEKRPEGELSHQAIHEGAFDRRWPLHHAYGHGHPMVNAAEALATRLRRKGQEEDLHALLVFVRDELPTDDELDRLISMDKKRGPPAMVALKLLKGPLFPIVSTDLQQELSRVISALDRAGLVTF